MEQQCNNTCDSIESAMYHMYELTNVSVAEKLQEFSTILERIGNTPINISPDYPPTRMGNSEIWRRLAIHTFILILPMSLHWGHIMHFEPPCP